MILTDDGGEPPLSSVSVMHYGQTSYHGETGYSVSNGTGMSVVSHSTLVHGVSGGSGVSGSTGGTGLSGLSGGTGVAVSTGMIGHTTKISGSAYGGGGGVYGGGGGSGGTGGTGMSGGSGLSGGTGGMVAMAMPGRAGGVSGVKTMHGVMPGSSELELYEDDDPGVITGAENSVLDDPIVTSYGQPIGDVLWPLLLMAMAYMLWIGRRYLRRNA